MLGRAKRSSRYELDHQISRFRSAFIHFFILHFQRFLQRFIDPTSTEDENAGLDLNEPLYMQKLEEVQPSPPFGFQPCLHVFEILSSVCDHSCRLFSDQCGRGAGPERELSPRAVL